MKRGQSKKLEKMTQICKILNAVNEREPEDIDADYFPSDGKN